jgi:hypothetical protein
MRGVLCWSDLRDVGSDRDRSPAVTESVSTVRFFACISAGIARVMGWMAGVKFAGGARDFALLLSVQTLSGAHPASYPMGTEGSFPRSKAARP